MSARIGCAAIILVDGPISGKPGEWRAELVDGGERSAARPASTSQVKMKLIHRLDLGDLQEERPAVGQHVGRPDRERVVARHARVPRATARASRTAAVPVIPGLGEMAARPLGD